MSRSDAPASRSQLGRDLTREARRLVQHINHLSVDELNILDGLVDEFAQIHADDEKCVNLCRRHKDHVPPWGSRYASLWERVWRSVFPNAWPP